MVAPDQMLGPYKLIAAIGAGGMGEVWKAEDTRLGRLVAVKILPQQIASDTEAIARMRREARTAAQLYHPNIATIHSFEEAEGRTFIVMELVDGEPLTALIARGALAESDVCRIGRGVAEALAEAHEHGIVHRDIKPDNIIVRGQRVKVLDFGIAKRVGVETLSSNDPTAFMTQQGMIVGTVHYMSPEQALGKSLDARTDIFSLGVVLYQAATGKLPFQGETITETMTQIIRDEPRAPRAANPSITPGLALLIERCMKKNRDERIGSAAEVSKELERLMAVVPTDAMTAPMAAATTAATAAMNAPLTARPLPRAGAAPTVIDGAPLPRRERNSWPLVAAVVTLAIGAAIAYAVVHRREPAAVQPKAIAAPAVVAPSTASVAVVDTTPTIVDTKTAAETAPVPATASEPAATATHAAAAPPSPPASPVATASEEPQADPKALYAAGLDHLVNGRIEPARESFAAAIRADPHFGKAHFRLGEIALLRRNVPQATQQFDRAIENAGTLDPRELALTNLGLAIARDDRSEAVRIAHEIHRMSPGDRDLAALHREFGAFFGRTDEQQPRGFPRRRWPRQR